MKQNCWFVDNNRCFFLRYKYFDISPKLYQEISRDLIDLKKEAYEAHRTNHRAKQARGGMVGKITFADRGQMIPPSSFNYDQQQFKRPNNGYDDRMLR